MEGRAAEAVMRRAVWNGLLMSAIPELERLV